MTQFLPYLLGEKDGQPKRCRPGAEKLCGIDADTIRRVGGGRWRATRTQIIAGWCVQRMQHGEQWSWMVVVLGGNAGTDLVYPGGGFGFGWHYNGAGTPGRKGIILSGFSGSDDRSASARQHGLQRLQQHHSYCAFYGCHP
ncbi:trimethylamine-N-oxide reductase [Salmonella enterica subsp. enterica]|nr:trimethylamine-N-oxide reductase [Salmonella enterica subsp. enterica]